MTLKFKTQSLSDLALPLLDLLVDKFLNPAATRAHDMVMVLSIIHFVARLVTSKMMSDENARLLELGEYPVDGRQAYIHVFIGKDAIDIFCAKMPGT